MALNTLHFLPPPLSPQFSLPWQPTRPTSVLFPSLSFRRLFTAVSAIGPDGKYYPTPSDDDPPEAAEDSMHGVGRFQQVQRQAARHRKVQEEELKKNQSIYANALADIEDAPEGLTSGNNDDSGDDFFGEIDKALSMKRKEFVKKGLLKANPKKEVLSEVLDELEPEEVADLEEIKDLGGISEDDLSGGSEEEEEEDEFEVSDQMNENDSPSFDIDFDEFSRNKDRIVEPKFRMSLAELLDESRVVPVSVNGNLEVEISGIQHDSRLVESGDLFVCCAGSNADAHLFLSEADKRGAVATVASQEIDIEETLGCKALVMVEDTRAVLASLAASFYKYPSESLSVIGITGTNGKTTTSYLIKGMYEAMGVRTGMLSSVSHYVHGDNKLEASDKAPDAILVQKLMAKMVHNGTETLVMEASSEELALGRCDKVDFDIAVFLNLTNDGVEFHGTEKECRNAQSNLFFEDGGSRTP